MINKCPYRNSERINKYGHKCNKQRYICRNCSKSFYEVNARVKRPLEQRKLCLILYSLGSSKNWIKAGIKALKFDIDNKINNDRCNIEVINQNIKTTLEDIKKNIIEIKKDIKDMKDGIIGLVKEVKDKGRSKNKKGGKKVA